MPSYRRLSELDDAIRNRTIEGLLALRKGIADAMPQRTAEETLLLGTWNIRNFDNNTFGHGPRFAETFFYLAEMVAAFDIVALQEINRDLGPLETLMDILGPEYDFIVTDVTEGPGGNKERLGFVFNRNKVCFKGVAGEIVLKRTGLIAAEGDRYRRQFARTPFACAFQAHWFKFMFATVHVYFGKESRNTPQFKRRVKEIEKVAKFLAERADEEEDNYVLVGDFNITSTDPNDPTFRPLEKNGFTVFKNRRGSNRQQTSFFDQISFKTRPGELELSGNRNAHGVFNFFDHVYRNDQFEAYDGYVLECLDRREAALRDDLARARSADKKAKIQARIEDIVDLKTKKRKRETYYKNEWRTYQMSDHYPLWVEVKIDFSDDHLRGRLVP